MSGFEILEHTADAGVRAQGQTREAVLENAAQGFYALALQQKPQGSAEKFTFHFQAENLESLLVRFLEELVYLLYTRNRVGTKYDLKLISDSHLEAEIEFQSIQAQDIAREIKSPTFHQLKFEQRGDAWLAEVYFDL